MQKIILTNGFCQGITETTIVHVFDDNHSRQRLTYQGKVANMLELGAIYKNHNGQAIQDNVCHSHNAAVLLFPFKAPKTADWAISVAPGEDMIDRRMKAPLSSHETTALWDMIKYRAKQLEQAIWVTTGTFLTTMGVEEMDDLRRCDFVRAVEYLTPSALPAQTQSAV